MRRHRWLAVAAVVAVVATACGTRLDEADFISAGALSEDTGGAGGSASGPSGPTGSGDATGSGGGGAGGNTPGVIRTGGGGSGGSGGTAGGGSTGGGGTGGSDGGGGARDGGDSGGGPNTASDVGVTETSIKVGNITGIQGLLGPDAFTPMLHGAQAYFAALNDRGGVNGRKIDFVTCDDRDDTERSQACVRKLIDQDKVFALVANSSTAYDPAAKYTNEKGVPDVGGGPIGNANWRYPHLYSIIGGGGYPRDGNIGIDGKLTARTGTYRWFKEKLGVSKAAVFHYTIPISRQAGLFIADGLELEDISVEYFGGGSDRGREATDPNYDSDVIEMRERGVDNVWNAIDIAGFQKLCQAMDRQGFTVKASVATVQGWGQKIGEEFSHPCRETVYSNDQWRSYAETDHPGIARMREVMARYKPNVSLRQWNVWGYGAGRLFTEGVASMGGNVTRAGLEQWLNQFTLSNPWTADGMHRGLEYDEYDFSKPLEECFTIARWQDAAGTFVTSAPAFSCYTTQWYSYTPQDTGG